MKGAFYHILALLLLSLCFGCQQENPPSEQKKDTSNLVLSELNAQDVYFDRNTSLYRYINDSASVTGIINSYFSKDRIHKSISVIAGRKEGRQLTYFEDGKLKFSENFVDNKRHGVSKKWTIAEGYQLVAELSYLNGKLDGIQKQWFASGELHKLLQMKNGREEGLQRAYRKNGVLYANYEAVNGRSFGMRRTELCYELEKEELVYNE